jgi:GYF domain 2
MDHEWYYGRGTKQAGPMSLEELRARLIQDGDLTDAFIWREGFDNWKRAPEVEELYPRKPPPLPIKSPDAGIGNGPAQPKPEMIWWKTPRITGSIGGALIGLALSKIVGAAFWFPAITIGGAWFIFSKWKVPHALVPVMAILVGHTVWIAIGIGTNHDTFLSMFDVVIVSGLMIWVLKERNRASCIGIIVYEVFALGLNFSEAGDQPGLALTMTMHIVLRLCAIAAATFAVMKLSKEAPISARGTV